MPKILHHASLQARLEIPKFVGNAMTLVKAVYSPIRLLAEARALLKMELLSRLNNAN